MKSIIIFKALSDFNRLRILKALQTKPLCLCELKELLELANSTISQHTKILRNANFIYEKKSGKWTDFYINYNSEDQRIIAILTNLDFWINDENQIIEDKIKLQNINRNIVCKV